MTLPWQADSTVIDCVRIQANQADADAARRRLEAALRTATLRPSRLPRSALLIVRTLQAPEPRLHPGVHPTQARAAEWHDALNRELDRIAGEAERPAAGAVSLSAKCVLFNDRAEMLACLALDWMQRTVRNHWWWHSMIRGDLDATIAREWLSAAEFVPAAMQHLARRSHATSFVERLDEALVTALAERMCQAFAVPDAALSSEERLAGVADRFRSLRLNSHVAEDWHAAATPWRLEVPEADSPGLTTARRIFLAQALMLCRAPARARSRAFQRAVIRWKNVREESTPNVLEPAADSPLDQPGERGAAAYLGESARPNAAVSALQDPADQTDGANRSVDHPQSTPHQAAPEAMSSAEGPHIQAQDAGIAPAGIGSPAETASSTAQNENAADVAGILAAAPDAAISTMNRTPAGSIPATSLLCQVHTSFAGVFFFLNLALALGLYSDFTSPQGKNLELDIWDFLWLLALEILGTEVRNDGLGFVLAMLAGRTTDDPPGSYFRPPTEWRVPDEWLEAFPEELERSRAEPGGRSRVMHPAGFLVQDEAPALETNRSASIEQWIGWLALYVRARLARAIGRQDAAEFLCRVAGTIRISDTHLDIHFSLQDHPIEIRLSGLDRDPGWIPAGGRHVAYHFD